MEFLCGFGFGFFVGFLVVGMVGIFASSENETPGHKHKRGNEKFEGPAEDCPICKRLFLPQPWDSSAPAAKPPVPQPS